MQKQKKAPAGESINQKPESAYGDITIPDTNLDAIEAAEREEAARKRKPEPCGCGSW